MDVLQELKEAQENKFRHEQDLTFKAKVRRNRLVGLWAAELMELSKSEADIYAEEIVELHLRQTGIDRLQSKLLDDFNHAGVHKSPHRIERQIHEFMAEAESQIRSE